MHKPIFIFIIIIIIIINLFTHTHTHIYIYIFFFFFFFFCSLTGKIKKKIIINFTIKCYGLLQENENHSGSNC